MITFERNDNGELVAYDNWEKKIGKIITVGDVKDESKDYEEKDEKSKSLY